MKNVLSIMQLRQLAIQNKGYSFGDEADTRRKAFSVCLTQIFPDLPTEEKGGLPVIIGFKISEKNIFFVDAHNFPREKKLHIKVGNQKEIIKGFSTVLSFDVKVAEDQELEFELV